MEEKTKQLEKLALKKHQLGNHYQAIDEYIQFYNNERYQEKLNGLSPLEFRVQPLKAFLLFPLST